jgi:ribosomal protein L40E
MVHAWHCEKCGALLGVERRGGLHLRHKEQQYVVGGEYNVIAVCRRCSAVNEKSATRLEAAAARQQ